MSVDETEGLCCVRNRGSDKRSGWKCQIPQGREEKGKSINLSLLSIFNGLVCFFVLHSIIFMTHFVLHLLS